ncbi:MAG: FG-GAP-like repeat-containing protein [Phycisphaerales bacterium JB052]
MIRSATFILICCTSIGSAQPCDPIGLFYGADSVVNNRFQSEIAAGDLNQDGYPDLVVPGFRTIHFNDGSGRFGDGVYLPSVGARDPNLVDLDADGDLDLVVRDGAFIKVVLNPGDGMLEFDASYTDAGGISNVDVVDLNLDGSPDLVWTNSERTGMLLNDGDGRFTALDTSTSDFGDGGTIVEAADLDGDLIPEIVLTHERLIRIYRADAIGEYALVQAINIGLDFSAEHVQNLLLEDLNGDGFPELTFSSLSIVPSRPDFVTVYRNLGDATFVPRDNHPIFDVAVGLQMSDIDQDGINDLLVSDQNSHSLWVLRGNGAARFTAVGPINSFGAAPLDAPRHILCPDLNLDGVPDLVVGNYGGSTVSYAFNRCGTHPCPPDLTGEGTLDEQDIDAFLDAYLDENPAVDFDRDGQLTHRDVSGFIVAFQSGCP